MQPDVCGEPGKCDSTSSHPAKDSQEVKSFDYEAGVLLHRFISIHESTSPLIAELPVHYTI